MSVVFSGVWWDNDDDDDDDNESKEESGFPVRAKLRSASALVPQNVATPTNPIERM